MGPILYHLVLRPLSRLPLSALYGLSRLGYWLGYRLLAYRADFVRSNMQRAFPEWTEGELDKQVDLFYRYFFDTIAESIKLFDMSGEEAVERCSVTNPESITRYAAEGRSVIIVGAHYSNWEIAGLSLPLIFPDQQVVALYSPLKNDTMDALIRSNRERTGIDMLSRRRVTEYYGEERPRPAIEFFVADQSPSNHIWQKLHWTNFLHQATGFVAGPERYAVRFNRPVFYMNLRMVGRGKYVATATLITEEPTKTSPGEITERFARILEQEIRQNPTPWLWTHRRWKRGAPDEVLETLAQGGYVGPRYSVEKK